MRYRFSLGRREAAAVLAGTAAVGVLLFCSGLLAGIAVADTERPVAAEDAAYAAEPPAAEPAPDGEPAPAREPAPAPASAEETGGAAAVVPTWSDAWTGEPAMGGPGDEPADGAEPVPGGGEHGDARPATQPDPLWPAAGSEARPADPGRSEWSRSAPAASASRRPPAPPVRDFERDPPRFSAYDGGGPYALQVGRYREEESALEVMQDLHGRGHQAYLFTKADRQGPIFHVRLGRYHERAAAMRAAEALERREQLAALVVPAEQ